VQEFIDCNFGGDVWSIGAIDNAGDDMSDISQGSAHATSPTTLVMIKSDIYCCKVEIYQAVSKRTIVKIG